VGDGCRNASRNGNVNQISVISNAVEGILDAVRFAWNTLMHGAPNLRGRNLCKDVDTVKSCRAGFGQRE
jgi:hypothetical protein